MRGRGWTPWLSRMVELCCPSLASSHKLSSNPPPRKFHQRCLWWNGWFSLDYWNFWNDEKHTFFYIFIHAFHPIYQRHKIPTHRPTTLPAFEVWPPLRYRFFFSPFNRSCCQLSRLLCHHTSIAFNYVLLNLWKKQTTSFGLDTTALIKSPILRPRIWTSGARIITM